MSTNYYLKKQSRISFSKFKAMMKSKNALKRYGMAWAKSKDENKNSFAIVDEDGNYLWVYATKTGMTFSRYGSNAVEDMIEIISGMLHQDIVSEYDMEEEDFQ